LLTHPNPLLRRDGANPTFQGKSAKSPEIPVIYLKLMHNTFLLNPYKSAQIFLKPAILTRQIRNQLSRQMHALGNVRLTKKIPSHHEKPLSNLM